MATYYIDDTGGSDLDDGLTTGNAWATFAHAMNTMVAGDILEVRGGTYTEVVIWTKAGTSGNRITVRCYSPGGVPESVTFTGQNYTFPEGEEGGSDGTFNGQPIYAHNYKGLFEIRASYVTFQGPFYFVESKGRGLEVFGEAQGTRVVGVECSKIYTNGTRNSGINIEGADDFILSDFEINDACKFAPFHRSSRLLNHPGVMTIKASDGFEIRNGYIHHGYGEGLMVSWGAENGLVENVKVVDCMWVLFYIHRCSYVTFLSCKAVHTGDEGFGGSDPPACYTFNNEDLKPGWIDMLCDHIDLTNCLAVGGNRSLSLLGGQSGDFPFSNIRVRYCTFVNPFSEVATAACIFTSNQGSYSAILFANNVVYASDAAVDMAQSNTNPAITWRYNNWYRAPATAVRGTGDVIGNPSMVAPDTTVTVSGFTPNNYKLQPSSVARYAGVVYADVTVDAFGVARPGGGPHSMGFDQAGDADDPPGETAAAVLIGVSRATIPTSIGTTSATDSNFSGDSSTPKFSLIYANKATTIVSGDADKDHAASAWGMTDGTNSASVSFRARDNQPTTETRTYAASSKALVMIRDASTSSLEADLTATHIANGIQYSAGTAPLTAVNAMAWHIGGDDVTAQVGTLSFASGDTSKNITFSFSNPNLLFTIGISGADIDATFYNGYNISIGIATSTTNQWGYTYRSLSAVDTSDVRGRIDDGYIARNITSGQTHKWTTISGTTGTILREGATGVKGFIWGALKIANADIYVGNKQFPTGTGAASFDFGFASKFAGFIGTLLQSINSEVSTADASAFSVSLITEFVEYAMAHIDEAGQGTSDTGTTYGAKAVRLPTAVGTAGFVATRTNLSSPGASINFSATPGTARQVLGWAIEKTVTATITADFTATPLTGTRPLAVTFTNSSSASGTTITTYQWNFGDGTTSTTTTPSHTYTVAGTYTVILTASDGTIQNTKTRTNYITVSDPAPAPPTPDGLTEVRGGAIVASTLAGPVGGGAILG